MRPAYMESFDLELASMCLANSGVPFFPAEAPSGGDGATGRLSRGPNPTVFELLYEAQAKEDRIQVLPYLLKIDAAHIVMITQERLLPRGVAVSLLQVNRELQFEDAGAFPLPHAHRGLYWLYEQEYIVRLGKRIGGAAHLARSRNDINATVTRLRVRQALLDLLAEFCRLANTLAQAAEDYADTTMSGFTHLQPAQPSTLGHYFAGILAALLRSAEQIDNNFDVVNCSPMGAAAGFGTSFPIDRAKVAELLGFSALLENSSDAVASRDYLIYALSGMAALGVTLSRLSTDLQTWSSAAFGFLDWPDDLVSTSSIMPQKRNAFIFENIRGQVVRPLGSLVSTLAGMKNTPFSNSVEISAESTSHFWPALTALQAAIRLTRLVVGKVNVSSRRAVQFLESTQTTMTALADLLVSRHGLAFRTAHDAVSRLANQYACIPQVEELKLVLERIVADINGTPVKLDEKTLARALDPVACVQSAAYGGGPAAVAVRAHVRLLVGRVAQMEARLTRRRQSLRDADGKLQAAVTEIVESRS